MIFAIDRNNLFGNQGKLAWHYKEDLQYFKEKTLNKKCIMGEETFKSVLRNGKPLPNRTSVIATLTDYTFEGVEVTHDIFKYLEDHKEEDLFIIGGKKIIELTYKLVDTLFKDKKISQASYTFIKDAIAEIQTNNQYSISNRSNKTKCVSLVEHINACYVEIMISQIKYDIDQGKYKDQQLVNARAELVKLNEKINNYKSNADLCEQISKY